MKKFKVLAFAFILCLTFNAGNVNAATINVSPTDNLSDKITNAEAGDELILADGTYDGDITLDKEITIKGTTKDSSIINGQVNIASDDAMVTLQNLTITKMGMDTAGVKLTGTSRVTLDNVIVKYANINGNDYGHTDYFTGVWLTKTANGSTVTVNNSDIYAKYGIWVYGEENEININNSNLNGWAALDISNGASAVTKALNNNVTISGSTLTGFATLTGSYNYYGTIVIGGQNGLNLTIDNSTIANGFQVQNVQDLIVFADSYLASENVSIEITSSELNNTDKTTDSSVINYGTKETDQSNNTLVMLDTTVNSENGQIYKTPTGYVTFTVDILGVKSTVTIPQGSSLTEEEINELKNIDLESLGLTNYELIGYYEDEFFTQEFDFRRSFDENTTMYVQVMEIEETVPVEPVEEIDNIENPETSDGILTYVIIAVIGTLGIAGTTFWLKLRKTN